MKTTKFIFIPVLVLFILSITSCAKQKLSNSWQVSYFKENGVDKTSEFHILFPNYKITFHDEGDFVVSASPLGVPISLTGTWSFENGGKQIKLVYDDQNEGTDTWDCLKLTSSELNVSKTRTENGDTIEEEVLFISAN